MNEKLDEWTEDRAGRNGCNEKGIIEDSEGERESGCVCIHTV